MIEIEEIDEIVALLLMIIIALLNRNIVMMMRDDAGGIGCVLAWSAYPRPRHGRLFPRRRVACSAFDLQMFLVVSQ